MQRFTSAAMAAAALLAGIAAPAVKSSLPILIVVLLGLGGAPALAQPEVSGPSFDCRTGPAGDPAPPTCECRGTQDCADMGQAGVCKTAPKCRDDICTCEWRLPRGIAPAKAQPQLKR